jgi:hypothetical protein
MTLTDGQPRQSQFPIGARIRRTLAVGNKSGLPDINKPSVPPLVVFAVVANRLVTSFLFYTLFRPTSGYSALFIFLPPLKYARALP